MEDFGIAGLFSTQEYYLLIIVLKLKAELLEFQTLCKNGNSSHILILIDNTLAVAAIIKMGNTKSLDMKQKP